jgi:hypothetical protein
LVPADLALGLVQRFGYLIILAATFGFVFSLIALVIVPEHRPRWDAGDWKLGAAALAGAVLWQLLEPHGFKVLMDELVIQGTAMTMHFDREILVPLRGHEVAGEFLAEHGVRLVEQAPRGRGEAFRSAVAHSTSDVLVLYSPDGNEDPADIDRLFLAIENGADLAIASRFLPESRNEEDDSALPLRKWANQAFGAAANLIWNRKGRISDTINGFRAIRRGVFERLDPGSIGFTIEYELSIRGMKAGVNIVEIPTIEGDRIGGETKAHSIRTGLRFLGREIIAGKRF